MAQPNQRILVSIARGGSGDLHIDFTRRVEVEASLVFPAKNTLRPKSSSNRDSVLSFSSGSVLTFGVGMYFKPSPSSVLASGGRMHPVVRSWNARFVTGGN